MRPRRNNIKDLPPVTTELPDATQAAPAIQAPNFLRDIVRRVPPAPRRKRRPHKAKPHEERFGPMIGFIMFWSAIIGVVTIVSGYFWTGAICAVLFVASMEAIMLYVAIYGAD